MAKCPDCDSIKILFGGEEGDGKCSVCHGTGKGGILDHLAHLIGGAEPDCDVCNGSGICQTCGGTGVAD